MIINIKNIADNIKSDLRYLGNLPYPNSKLRAIIKKEEAVLNRVLTILVKYGREEKSDYEK